ncbi:hypothetical protein JCM24511_06806 [Saitozyma sp. JCM 24511]|nr:hypothetical protein JCM24511_06806 [Saitozyma sp. JCM 24511]
MAAPDLTHDTARLFSSGKQAPLHPLPPFTEETAKHLGDTCNPQLVSPAYTPDSLWRNRDEFFSGREAIEAFLRRKWDKEHNYRLRKELFCFQDNRIAVEFWYEYSESDDPCSQWYRTYGLEHWVFGPDGRMSSRQMSGNTIPIKNVERWFKDGVDVNDGDVLPGHISRK